MARKLKSDKLLFLSVLLLVGCSVVMVYSASAVIAMEQYSQPYFFLFKQVTWVVLGLCLLRMAMRVDYRHLQQPVVIWSALGASIVALLRRPSLAFDFSAKRGHLETVFLSAIEPRPWSRCRSPCWPTRPC